MTQISPAQKKDIVSLLAPPARYQELKPVLDRYRTKPACRLRHSFERALREEGFLHEMELQSENGQAVTLYSSCAPEKWNPYQVAQALAPTGYFCNLTSVYYHALTDQVPQKIFVATEGARQKDQQQRAGANLTDADIFQAFMIPPRMTKHVVPFRDRAIVITERVARNAIGVETVYADNRICPKGSRVTCVERALIDAVVLPQYNGGIRATIDTFRNAIPHIKQQRLLELYDGLSYAYPYSQALGFLFDRLGAHNLATRIGSRYPVKYKFYLDHGAKTSWEFDAKWQIFYPKGVI